MLRTSKEIIDLNLPFFYITDYNVAQKEILLEEDTSKHIVQVLRMKVGDQLNLTDGKGNLLTAAIIDDHKKHCKVEIQTASYQSPAPNPVCIAISLIKNATRFEWFLEKATEIGVAEIIPLICERTEKEKFRFERMQGICISAMLQSQQCWLPVLHEPMKFETVVMRGPENAQKFIAHCIEGQKQVLRNFPISLPIAIGTKILIGPEGDFTPEEIAFALQNDFVAVSLGNTRLRTETGGVVAAALLRI